MNPVMELQHINVKLFLDPAPSLNLWEVVPVFHSWIQTQLWEELLIDVADYRHVPAGPGIVLVGHEADYSVDNSENRLGLRYNRKTKVNGTNQDRLRQAFRAALMACERLEADDRLKGQIRFGRSELKVFVNDRLLVPNLPSSYESIEPEIKLFFADLLNESDFVLSREDNPRNLFGLTVKASREFEIEKLVKKISGKISEPILNSSREKIN
jgi:hypothetical protein